MTPGARGGEDMASPAAQDIMPPRFDPQVAHPARVSTVSIGGRDHCDRHGLAPVDQPPADDASRWREAARLRRDHPKWIVIWLAPISRFRAYARLPGARRDTALTAADPAALAAQIGQAEQAARQSKDRM